MWIFETEKTSQKSAGPLRSFVLYYEYIHGKVNWKAMRHATFIFAGAHLREPHPQRRRRQMGRADRPRATRGDGARRVRPSIGKGE